MVKVTNNNILGWLPYSIPTTSSSKSKFIKIKMDILNVYAATAFLPQLKITKIVVICSIVHKNAV